MNIQFKEIEGLELAISRRRNALQALQKAEDELDAIVQPLIQSLHTSQELDFLRLYLPDYGKLCSQISERHKELVFAPDKAERIEEAAIRLAKLHNQAKLFNSIVFFPDTEEERWRVKRMGGDWKIAYPTGEVDDFVLTEAE